MVREIAAKHGDWHRPAFYIDEVLRRTGHRICHGTVIASLGRWDSRIATTPSAVKRKARELLDACSDDVCLAKRMLTCVSL